VYERSKCIRSEETVREDESGVVDSSQVVTAVKRKE